MAPLTADRAHISSRWRGALFNALFYAWTILLLPVCLVIGPVSRAGLRNMCRVWAKGALGLLAVTVGLRYEVRGHGNLPSGPVMVAVKHQSAWETLALNLTVHDPAFVLKKELTQIPIFGWLLPHAGMIAVDRQGGASALRNMVIAARHAIADGRPVVIFPEGTRTPPGQRRAYHPGVAALYGALGVQVVPVALNSGLFWPRRDLRLKPGRILIEFLPAIPPGLSRREFMARLEKSIETATDDLVAEALDIHPYLEKPAPD